VIGDPKHEGLIDALQARNDAQASDLVGYSTARADAGR
jgi:hypothetical protein